MAQTLARELKHRVGNGRCHTQHPNFSHARGRGTGGNNLGVNLGHVAHAQHRVIMEVGLNHGTVLHVEFFDKCQRQAKHCRTLKLGQHVVGLNHQARVNRNPVVVNLDLSGAAVQRHLNHTGRYGAVIVSKSDAQAATLAFALPV